MAKRQAIIKVESEEVQGEGSFVKVRSILWGDAKRLKKDLAGMDEDDKLRANDELIAKHVYEWDWVDEDGNPLPLPKDDPTVLDLLTAHEIKFLGKALSGGDDDTKK
jgi:hypothetical protein